MMIQSCLNGLDKISFQFKIIYYTIKTMMKSMELSIRLKEEVLCH